MILGVPRLGVVILIIGMTVGCAPRVKIVKNPSDCDEGVRYYRPKPYLLITPSEKVDQSVQIALQYLPDFSQEYAVNVRPGLGIASVKLELKDGWNLTSINQELDSQSDEIVEAAADLVGSIGSVTKQTVTDEVVVPASNVPLGFYEAVIGCGGGCGKQLQGWRYVGFMPFNGCPTTVNGSDCLDCHENVVYGLVFEDRVLKFKPIGHIDFANADSLQ